MLDRAGRASPAEPPCRGRLDRAGTPPRRARGRDRARERARAARRRAPSAREAGAGRPPRRRHATRDRGARIQQQPAGQAPSNRPPGFAATSLNSTNSCRSQPASRATASTRSSASRSTPSRPARISGSAACSSSSATYIARRPASDALRHAAWSRCVLPLACGPEIQTMSGAPSASACACRTAASFAPWTNVSKRA